MRTSDATFFEIVDVEPVLNKAILGLEALDMPSR